MTAILACLTTWVYFGDGDVVINRMAEFKNFSKGGAPENHTVVVAEVTLPSDNALEHVPRTGDRVLEALTRYLNKPPGRLVLPEYDFQIGFSTRHRQGSLAVELVDDLASQPRTTLNRADAIVFRLDRLEEAENGAVYRRQMESLLAEGVHISKPSLFRAWGPALVALVNPHKPLQAVTGEWVRSPRHPRLFVARVGSGEGAEGPAAGALLSGGLVSLEFSLPRSMGARELEKGNRRHRVVEFWPMRSRKYFVSRRFNANDDLTLRIRRISGPDRVPFVLRSWKRKGSMVRRPEKGEAGGSRGTPVAAEEEGTP